MAHHKLILWGLVGVAAGVYLAGASGGTGIFGLPVIGSTLETTIYAAGSNAAGGAPAASTGS